MSNNPVDTINGLWEGIKKAMGITKEAKIAYIAGLMFSDPDYKKKFDRAAVILNDAGYIVLSPAWQPSGLTHEQYIAISGQMLNCCNHIFLLTGWDESPEATETLKKALERDIEIHDFRYWCWKLLEKELQDREA